MNRWLHNDYHPRGDLSHRWRSIEVTNRLSIRNFSEVNTGDFNKLTTTRP